LRTASLVWCTLGRGVTEMGAKKEKSQKKLAVRDLKVSAKDAKRVKGGGPAFKKALE